MKYIIYSHLHTTYQTSRDLCAALSNCRKKKKMGREIDETNPEWHYAKHTYHTTLSYIGLLKGRVKTVQLASRMKTKTLVLTLSRKKQHHTTRNKRELELLWREGGDDAHIRVQTLMSIRLEKRGRGDMKDREREKWNTRYQNIEWRRRCVCKPKRGLPNPWLISHSKMITGKRGSQASAQK